ncbi:MAG: hypothetical protein AB7G75_22335 [Candidatus Binatia bacterium]
MSFRPQSVLLDKGVVRRVYEARVRFALNQPPTLTQAEATNIWFHLRARNTLLYITEQTAHILERRPPVFAAALQAQTLTLQKGRYLRRWARRLRDEGFSPEDAIVLAYGSFGVDLQAQRVGVEFVITHDLRLVTNFTNRFAAIRSRFEQMVLQLPEPYQRLTFPGVMATTAILAEL